MPHRLTESRPRLLAGILLGLALLVIAGTIGFVHTVPAGLDARAKAPLWRQLLDHMDVVRMIRASLSQAPDTASGSLLLAGVQRQLAGGHMTLRLINPDAVPGKAERVMDALERRALETLVGAPDGVVTGEDISHGQRLLRAIAFDSAYIAATPPNPRLPVAPVAPAAGSRRLIEITMNVEAVLAAADARCQAVRLKAMASATVMLLGLALALWAVRRRDAERNEALALSRMLALYDPLTGVLKRHALAARIEAAMLPAPKGGINRNHVLHLVDIDRFTPFLDLFGHAAGDQLLRLVADLLRDLGGGKCLVGRMASDQFAVFEPLPEPAEPEDGRVMPFPQRLRERMAGLNVPGTHPVPICVTLGGALMRRGEGPPGTVFPELLERAELALASARRAKVGERLFAPEMRQAQQRRRLIEKRLTMALADTGLTLAFQPICAARTRKIIGFETLLRLDDGQGGQIPPSEFIPVAEATGMMGRLGDWVLDAALSRGARLPHELFIAVNLSAQQFAPDRRDGATLSERVARAAATHGFDLRRLELEITETLFLDTTDTINRELMRLCEMGIMLAMDDFGTGYSSLSYLWKLPFSKVKIDRSFVEAVVEGRTHAAVIVEAIVRLCHQLEMVVCVEGLENEAQVLFFEALACQQLQGYHLGRPGTFEVAELSVAALQSARTRRLFSS